MCKTDSLNIIITFKRIIYYPIALVLNLLNKFLKMVKILMRADTHVSFSVPAEEPEAKCTKSQANKYYKKIMRMHLQHHLLKYNFRY